MTRVRITKESDRYITRDIEQEIKKKIDSICSAMLGEQVADIVYTLPKELHTMQVKTHCRMCARTQLGVGHNEAAPLSSSVERTIKHLRYSNNRCWMSIQTRPCIIPAARTSDHNHHTMLRRCYLSYQHPTTPTSRRPMDNGRPAIRLIA